MLKYIKKILGVFVLKIFAPEYYNSFKCIADKCKHSCCVGWDIEIDSDMLDIYLNAQDNFGDKLKANIITNEDISSFKLDEKKRCPFLNDNGLCEIILEKGEDYLCGICTDHPRFRNFFSDREEIGLGLCCEEAARIILTTDLSSELQNIGKNSEEDFECEDIEVYVVDLRNKLFEIIDNDKNDYDKCRFEFAETIDREIPIFTGNDVKNAYLVLEMLDKSWGSLIKGFCEYKCHMPSLSNEYSDYAKRLLSYFIFRHFADTILDGRIYERTVFSVLSTEIIIGISDYLSDGKIKLETICDVARRYSSEIEYSDENIEKILDYIAKKSTE